MKNWIFNSAGQYAAAFDGFDGGGYQVEVCDVRYSGVHASCQLQGPQHPAKTITVKGIIVTNNTLLIGGAIQVDAATGIITRVGCAIPYASQTFMIDCPGAVISPGLINLHEHSEFSFQQPEDAPSMRWKHRNEWRAANVTRRGFATHEYKSNGTLNAMISQRVMLRHSLMGTTALVGGTEHRGFLRNLEISDRYLGSPQQTAVESKTFPIRPTGVHQCNEYRPYVPHVGEGINDVALSEIDTTLGVISGKQTPTALVHSIPINASQIHQITQLPISIVVSVQSNLNLYGATSPIPQLLQAGVNMVLSPDWTPSGSMNMLDELRCTAYYNQHSLNHLLSWADLHRMMTANAARAIGIEKQIGTLAPGLLADFTIIDSQGADSFSEILSRAGMRHVIANFIAGRAAHAPSDWFPSLIYHRLTLENCAIDTRMMCGQNRTICGLGSADHLSDLLDNEFYVLDDAAQCDPKPVTECIPRRPNEYSGEYSGNDYDGDGVPNELDNCPWVFNPVLDVDNGSQRPLYLPECFKPNPLYWPDSKLAIFDEQACSLGAAEKSAANSLQTNSLLAWTADSQRPNSNNTSASFMLGCTVMMDPLFIMQTLLLLYVLYVAAKPIVQWGQQKYFGFFSSPSTAEIESTTPANAGVQAAVPLFKL